MTARRKERCPPTIALVVALLVLTSLACGPPQPPLCQTAAGRYARAEHLGRVSISCAQGIDGPCVMSYTLPTKENTVHSVSLLCGAQGCTCIGDCP